MEVITTSLRKVGGSVMLTVPPSCLDQFQLKPGSMVGIVIEGKRLFIEPKPRPKYTLTELLAMSDYSSPQPAQEREWVDALAVGQELM